MRAFLYISLYLLALAVLSPAQRPGAPHSISEQNFKNPQNLGPDMPTPPSVVDEMLRVAKVQPGEMVYDLGCGDARILIAAVQKYGARGVGIELVRDMAEKTSAHIKAMGLDDRIRIVHGSAIDADLSPADVVTLYFTTSSNDRLKPALRRLHQGARVVSHDYEMRGWDAVDTKKIKVIGVSHTIYLYEVKR